MSTTESSTKILSKKLKLASLLLLTRVKLTGISHKSSIVIQVEMSRRTIVWQPVTQHNREHNPISQLPACPSTLSTKKFRLLQEISHHDRPEFHIDWMIRLGKGFIGFLEVLGSLT